MEKEEGLKGKEGEKRGKDKLKGMIKKREEGERDGREKQEKNWWGRKGRTRQ